MDFVLFSTFEFHSSLDITMYKALPEYPSEIPRGKLVRLDCDTKQWFLSDSVPCVPSVPEKSYPVSPDIEVERSICYGKLKRYFYDNLPGYSERTGVFERWLWTQLCLQPEERDPLIPYSASVVDPRLEEEVKSLPSDFLEKISRESTRLCNKMATLESTRQAKVHQKTLPDGGLSLHYRGRSVQINEERLYILRERYTGRSFVNDLFCLLLRYHTLGSDGYQAAVPDDVFTYMKKTLRVSQECFASPLNSYFDTFCSAFLDTDRKFGSIGSFFRFFPESGIFECNPPFAEVIMQKMVEHMEYLLNATKKSLTFIVVVPKWDDAGSPMWMSMSHSRFLTTVLEVKPGHKYYKGDQHRNRKLWSTTHTTSIFVLQSKKSEGLTRYHGLEKLWNNLQ